MIFRLRVCEFHFRALSDVYFPDGKAGNVLRGAIWPALSPLCRTGRPVPGGFAEEPRAFVIRAAHLDAKRFAAGDGFSVGVHLFDTSPRWVSAIYGAFARLRETGIGPRRGRVDILNTSIAGRDVSLDLRQQTPAIRATVHFKTPTDLKGTAESEIPFATLLSAAANRVSILSRLHGESPLDHDFRGLIRRAHLVRATTAQLESHAAERLSTRTGQTHRIGGVTGTVHYEGDLSEFTPWLTAAYWTGVGRHTVWGNGVIEATFE